MQLRSGKIIQSTSITSEFKDNHAKLRPILRNIKKLIHIALKDDGTTTYDRLCNIYNVFKYAFNHTTLLCKDVSCNQFLHTVYLKAHDIICQIHDLENKIMNPQCTYLTKKVRSVSVAIIGRLEKLLQFSYK
jgi:hypothetical protein